MTPLLILAVAATGASTARPQGSYVLRDPAGPRFGPGPQHRIIYMNRHGGTYYSGYDDSSANVSSIPYSTSQLSAWSYGDASWAQVMACTRAMFSRFDVEITDVDPGDVPHIESAVGGTPGQVGMGSGVGGVAPMNTDCSVVETAIVFTFAGVYGDDPQSICETVAQEVSHALGLDHEYLCEDPMTYLYGCGEKTFQDADVACGEYSARQCMCGDSTQNSVQTLLAVLGAADAIGPDLEITQPADGATVQPGFAIAWTAADAAGVAAADVYLDGALLTSLPAPPWSFQAPADVADGPHTIEVRARDLAGNESSAQVAATVQRPGGGDPPDPGELGDPCGADADCASGWCDTETGGVCGDPDPGVDDEGPGVARGGCRAAGRTAPLGVLLLLLLAMLSIPRRR
jgi:hypothetical protein